MTSKELLELIDAYLWEIQEGKDSPPAEEILLDLKSHIKENSIVDIQMNKQGMARISDSIAKDLEVLNILKKYLGYSDSYYNNQADYGYAEFMLRLEQDSIWLDDEQREQLKKDFNKVKEWWNERAKNE